VQKQNELESRERILVTGGCGFIGTNYIHKQLIHSFRSVINLDKCTYAANPQNLAGCTDVERYTLVQGDICDRELLDYLLQTHRPSAIIHFAAESHVDRSITGPKAFVDTNILGTFQLLQAARDYWSKLTAPGREDFRFLHVSTDEVFGSLGQDERGFHEKTPYSPNSPYSASKAASDHMVRAYQQTYGLPTLTTNCSNNHGPFQFPEKLIPLVIRRAINGESLPIYGDGMNIRDWLFVGDHCSAIDSVLANGVPGETYNIGGNSERTNRQVVQTLCTLLDELAPTTSGRSYSEQITFVKDRPGHDRRYAVDASKILRELGWQPSCTFEQGMRRTVNWYLQNNAWLESIASGDYLNWIASNYEQRCSQ
jgi:dTDP-glucose 4,6-dehydratase